MKKRKGTALVHLSMLCIIVLILYSYSMIHIRAAHPTSTDTETQTSVLSVRDTITQLRSSRTSPQPSPGENVKTNARVDRKHIQKVKKEQKYDIYKLGCSTRFPDIQESPYQDDIKKAASLCIIQGYNNGKFYPENHLLYGDRVQLVSKGYEVMQDNRSAVIMTDMLDALYEPAKPVTWNRMKNILSIMTKNNSKEILLPTIANENETIVRRGEAIYILLQLGDTSTVQTDIDITEQDNAYDVGENILTTQVGENTVLYGISTDGETTSTQEGITQVQAMEKLPDTYTGFESDITQTMMPIPRDTFLYGLVRYQQKQHTSIPKEYNGPMFFEDIGIDHLYYDEIAIAKMMGLTSGREEIVRNKLYISPDRYVSVYEAKQRINTIHNLSITIDEQDKYTIVTAHQIEQRLMQDTTLQIAEANTMQAVQETENNPWLVEQMKPLVKQAVEMW